MSKDEERKKNADVYSSVTAGLQNVYKTKLLPLEKVSKANGWFDIMMRRKGLVG